MQRYKLCLVPLVLGISVLACNFSPSLTSPTPAPTLAEPTQPPATSAATVPATPAPAATSVPTTAAQATGAATALDPCQVVPLQEASDLVGVKLEAGREAPYPDGTRGCLYAAASGNVLTVDVFQAPDAATAKTNRDSFLSGFSGYQENAIGKSLEPTQVPDFADGAIEGEMHFTNAGVTLNGSAFAFVKGTTSVGIMDIGQDTSVPSLDALRAEATKALARIP